MEDYFAPVDLTGLWHVARAVVAVLSQRRSMPTPTVQCPIQFPQGAVESLLRDGGTAAQIADMLSELAAENPGTAAWRFSAVTVAHYAGIVVLMHPAGVHPNDVGDPDKISLFQIGVNTSFHLPVDDLLRYNHASKVQTVAALRAQWLRDAQLAVDALSTRLSAEFERQKDALNQTARHLVANLLERGQRGTYAYLMALLQAASHLDVMREITKGFGQPDDDV